MKIDSPIYTNKYALPPSFKGGGKLTARLYRTLYGDKSTLNALATLNESNPIVGNLPSEFIKVLKKKCKDKASMKEAVLSLYGAFENLGNSLRTIIGYDEKQIKKELPKIAKEFASSLKEVGLLGRLGSVKLKSLDGGAFSEAFSINFSNWFSSNKYSSKVIKIYKEVHASVKDRFHSSHGLVGETNVALFIKKIRGHRADNTDVTEYYFSNMKSKFMVTENAYNYKGQISSFFNRLFLFSYDLKTEGNLVNGKAVDMGGFVLTYPFDKFFRSLSAIKMFKKLNSICAPEHQKYQRHLAAGRQNKTPHYSSNKWKKVFYFNFIRRFNTEYKEALNNKCANASDKLKILKRFIEYKFSKTIDKFLYK